jgi:large subunit ribosomal protein L30
MEKEKKPRTKKSPQKDQNNHNHEGENRKVAGKVAVILIRNTTGSNEEVKDTLRMLRLCTKNSCAVFDKTPSIMGMLTMVKDYTTYGIINEETVKLLEEKRGKKNKDGELKKHFHLHPPRGGYERKGIKRPFMQGGALGYRGEKINELIKKML